MSLSLLTFKTMHNNNEKLYDKVLHIFNCRSSYFLCRIVLLLCLNREISLKWMRRNYFLFSLRRLLFVLIFSHVHFSFGIVEKFSTNRCHLHLILCFSSMVRHVNRIWKGASLLVHIDPWSNTNSLRREARTVQNDPRMKKDSFLKWVFVRLWKRGDLQTSTPLELTRVCMFARHSRDPLSICDALWTLLF